MQIEAVCHTIGAHLGVDSTSLTSAPNTQFGIVYTAVFFVDEQKDKIDPPKKVLHCFIDEFK